MMIETGTIEVTQLNDLRGNPERYEYRWIGRSPKCLVSILFLDQFAVGGKWNYKIGDRLQIGPFKLKLIEWGYPDFTVECIRMDYPFWWLFLFWHRTNRIVDLAYRRFIITLAVWHLAKYDPAVIPYWRDIYILQKISGFIKNACSYLLDRPQRRQDN